MNILAIFFEKILAKYFPKRTKLHHFLKFSRGSMPPNPPSKAHGFPNLEKKNYWQPMPNFGYAHEGI